MSFNKTRNNFNVFILIILQGIHKKDKQAYENVTLPTSSSGGFQVSVTVDLRIVLECVMVSLG